MQSWETSKCSWLLYGFCCLCAVLLITIIILIVHLQKPEIKDRSLEFEFGNFSVNVKTQVSQITQDGTRLMKKIAELETSVEQIQKDLSIGSLQSDMQKVLGTLGRLVDRVQTLQLNDSQELVCPEDWHLFTLNCYYVSKSGDSWEEAKKSCEGLNSHMVVINNEDEQNYVFGISKSQFTWIGLTDSDGEWKWLDGTPYNTSPKFWISGQPDNYFGHGLGGGEDCAHLHYNGGWNDDHCTRQYKFICEKAL
ncbi:hypothetical protein XELAEV_18001037mg [Xenopus laevis]|nr:hypothetical protein XELAEV_18001037mg [Xenopus laevis]